MRSCLFELQSCLIRCFFEEVIGLLKSLTIVGLLYLFKQIEVCIAELWFEIYQIYHALISSAKAISMKKQP